MIQYVLRGVYHFRYAWPVLCWSREPVFLVGDNCHGLYNYECLCYNQHVTAPILVTGRGCIIGYTILFYSLCVGQRSCLLPVQVAWWRRIDGNQAQTVNFSVKEGEPPKVFAVLSGVRPFASLGYYSLLPIGIIAYANQLCNIPENFIWLVRNRLLFSFLH